MTVILPFGRALTRQVLPRTNHLLTRYASTNPLLRVSYCETSETNDLGVKNGNRCIKGSTSVRRSYATAASSKPVGRPKAHTGRTTAKKTSTTKKTTTTEGKPVTKAKAKAKPKPKPKPRAKAKPKPKKVVKRPASKTATLKAQAFEKKAIKTRALLVKPKTLPSNAWQLYFTEQKKGTTHVSLADSAAKTKELAQAFKTLPPEEHERLNHTANQNKAKNEAEYKTWLSTFTPMQIKEANAARRTLNNEAKAKGSKRAPHRMLQDERVVKQSRNAYNYFSIERFASKDFRHMALAESARLIAKEWKALSESEKKTYQDQARADSSRYLEEYRTVYGMEPPSTVPSKKSRST